MSTDPDQIRHDIESTRAELSSDVDALTHKVNPRRVATASATRAKSRLHRAVDRVMGTTRDVRDAAVHQASETGQQMTEAAHRGVDASRNVAHHAADAASAAGHRAAALPRASRERAEGNPLAAGLIAFGVGLLTASLLPPADKERQLAARARQEAMRRSGHLKQQAGEAAHQMQDNLREPVEQASQAVRSTAARGAATVRDTGAQEARHVRDDVREAPRRL